VAPLPWLPSLVLLEDSGGDWFAYVELVYSHFYADFVRERPRYEGVRLGLKRLPMHQGKEATFWHMTSEGPDEAERRPDLRRCERIKWPRPTIEGCPHDDIKIWEEKRGGSERRIHLWCEDDDYLVVLARRKADTAEEYLLPWTAYVVDSGHRRRNLECRYRRWSRNS